MSLAAVTVIEEAKERDLRLSVEGDKLRCEGPKGALAKLRAKLVEHRQEIIAALSDSEWLVEHDNGSMADAEKCVAGTCGDDPDECATVTWTYVIDQGCRTKAQLFSEYEAVTRAEYRSKENCENRYLYEIKGVSTDGFCRIRNAWTGETRYVKTEKSHVCIADRRATTFTHRWTVAEEKLPAPEHLHLPKQKEARYYLKRAGSSADFAFLHRETTTVYERARIRWRISSFGGATGFVQLPTAMQHAYEQQADLYDKQTGKTLTYKALVSWVSLHTKGNPNKPGQSQPDFSKVGKMIREVQAKGEDIFEAIECSAT